jgi:xanthine dehydrogenase accessory factor
MSVTIIIRGGGDLASGIALRLFRSGLRLLITELPEPLVVRRAVSFAEAVYNGKTLVEGVAGVLAVNINQAKEIWRNGAIPVMVDPQLRVLTDLRSGRSDHGPVVLVDARMTKKPPETSLESAALVLGLGPGFTAGEDCHAVIETKRGHTLGRVIWTGKAEKDSSSPEAVGEHTGERVLHSPANGILSVYAQIGDHLQEGQLVAEVAGKQVLAPFKGALRGLIHPGIHVWRGLKLGDIDPRDQSRYCFLVSDKALALGGSVLEAILSRPELRPHLCEPT